MNLGMPTLVEFSSIEENIDLCNKLDLDFIELNIDLPYCMPNNNVNWKEIKKNSNIDFTVHLSEKLEVGEIYEDARKKQIEIIKNAINYYNKEANIKKYNMHLDRGVYFNLPDGKIYIFEKYKEKYEIAIDKSFAELSEFATENNIEIYFENTSITNYIAKSFEKLKKYNNLYYTLDVGHSAKDNYAADKLFMKTPNMIKHMHIHDFNGEKNHKELGIGVIDVKKYLKFCEQNNIYSVIEVKRKQELINSIDYIRKKE